MTKRKIFLPLRAWIGVVFLLAGNVAAESSVLKETNSSSALQGFNTTLLQKVDVKTSTSRSTELYPIKDAIEPGTNSPGGNGTGNNFETTEAKIDNESIDRNPKSAEEILTTVSTRFEEKENVSNGEEIVTTSRSTMLIKNTSPRIIETSEHENISVSPNKNLEDFDIGNDTGDFNAGGFAQTTISLSGDTNVNYINSTHLDDNPQDNATNSDDTEFTIPFSSARPKNNLKDQVEVFKNSTDSLPSRLRESKEDEINRSESKGKARGIELSSGNYVSQKEPSFTQPTTTTESERNEISPKTFTKKLITSEKPIDLKPYPYMKTTNQSDDSHGKIVMENVTTRSNEESTSSFAERLDEKVIGLHENGISQLKPINDKRSGSKFSTNSTVIASSTISQSIGNQSGINESIPDAENSVPRRNSEKSIETGRDDAVSSEVTENHIEGIVTKPNVTTAVTNGMTSDKNASKSKEETRSTEYPSTSGSPEASSNSFKSNEIQTESLDSRLTSTQLDVTEKSTENPLVEGQKTTTQIHSPSETEKPELTVLTEVTRSTMATTARKLDAASEVFGGTSPALFEKVTNNKTSEETEAESGDSIRTTVEYEIVDSTTAGKKGNKSQNYVSSSEEMNTIIADSKMTESSDTITDSDTTAVNSTTSTRLENTTSGFRLGNVTSDSRLEETTGSSVLENATTGSILGGETIDLRLRNATSSSIPENETTGSRFEDATSSSILENKTSGSIFEDETTSPRDENATSSSRIENATAIITNGNATMSTRNEDAESTPRIEDTTTSIRDENATTSTRYSKSTSRIEDTKSSPIIGNATTSIRDETTTTTIGDEHTTSTSGIEDTKSSPISGNATTSIRDETTTTTIGDEHTTSTSGIENTKSSPISGNATTSIRDETTTITTIGDEHTTSTSRIEDTKSSPISGNATISIRDETTTITTIGDEHTTSTSRIEDTKSSPIFGNATTSIRDETTTITTIGDEHTTSTSRIEDTESPIIGNATTSIRDETTTITTIGDVHTTSTSRIEDTESPIIGNTTTSIRDETTTITTIGDVHTTSTSRIEDTESPIIGNATTSIRDETTTTTTTIGDEHTTSTSRIEDTKSSPIIGNVTISIRDETTTTIGDKHATSTSRIGDGTTSSIDETATTRTTAEHATTNSKIKDTTTSFRYETGTSNSSSNASTASNNETKSTDENVWTTTKSAIEDKTMSSGVRVVSSTSASVTVQSTLEVTTMTQSNVDEPQITSLVQEVTLYVIVTFQESWSEVCPLLPSFGKSLAAFLSNGTNKNIPASHVVIYQNGCEVPIATDNTETEVRFHIVDSDGNLAVSTTKMSADLYRSSSFSSPLHIQKFVLVRDMDSTNLIAVVAVSSVALICLVLLAGLLFVMRKRQTRFNYGERCRPVSLDAYSLDSVSAHNSVRRKGAARSSKRSYGNPAFEDSSFTPSHPLNFAGLSSFCNDSDAIAEEFSSIPQVSARIDELPSGAEMKNRYANVVPLPETRVPLLKINDDPSSEYINASYVRGPKNATKYYIACQAPLESTITDFWRMIWEQQCKVIVMLTDIIENGVEKCAEYIPPSEVTDCHRLHGDFQVTLKKREAKEKYAISTIHLKNFENNTYREISHIWYLWPTNGVPSDSAGLIAVLLEARALHRGGPGPMVVHCSPGTGRTGTLIALDLGIRQYEITRTIDVPRVVYTIRRDRAGAVQTKEQYAFIYEALKLYAAKLAGGALESM